jgi:hypothetical protein
MLILLSLGIIYVPVLSVYCRTAAFKYYSEMRCDVRRPYNKRVSGHTVRYVIKLCQWYKASICLHCYHWVSYTCLYCQYIVAQQHSSTIMGLGVIWWNPIIIGGFSVTPYATSSCFVNDIKLQHAYINWMNRMRQSYVDTYCMTVRLGCNVVAEIVIM